MPVETTPVPMGSNSYPCLNVSAPLLCLCRALLHSLFHSNPSLTFCKKAFPERDAEGGERREQLPVLEMPKPSPSAQPPGDGGSNAQIWFLGSCFYGRSPGLCQHPLYRLSLAENCFKKCIANKKTLISSCLAWCAGSG